MMDLGKFIELLFYGSSSFEHYDSGMGVEYIVPEMHYRIFGVGFGDVGLDNYQL